MKIILRIVAVRPNLKSIEGALPASNMNMLWGRNKMNIQTENLVLKILIGKLIEK